MTDRGSQAIRTEQALQHTDCPGRRSWTGFGRGLLGGGLETAFLVESRYDPSAAATKPSRTK